MDQSSPGLSGNSHDQVSRSTRIHPDAAGSMPRLQDRVSPLANPSANQGLIAMAAGPSTLSGQGTGNAAPRPALSRRGSSFMPNRDNSLGYLGHPSQVKSWQKLTTQHGVFQAPSPSEQYSLSYRNDNAPAAFCLADGEEARQTGLGEVYQHGNVALQQGPEKDDSPDWSAMRSMNDPDELFIFGNEETCDTVPDGADPKGLCGDTRTGVPGQVLPEESTFQFGGTKLSSTRERVPTPGLSHILGSAPENNVTQNQSDNQTAVHQGHGPSATGAGSQQRSTQYYDYSEAFEHPTALSLHRNTRRTWESDSDSLEDEESDDDLEHRAWRGFNPGPQAGYGYSQACNRYGHLTYDDAAPGNVLSDLSHPRGREWMRQDKRGHAMQRAPNPLAPTQHPQPPLQEYAYSEPYDAHPQIPHGAIRAYQDRNRGHDVRVHPYARPYQGGYPGGRGCYRERRYVHQYTWYDHSPFRHHGHYQDAGNESFKWHYPNQENMPPLTEDQGLRRPEHGHAQEHQRVQNMVKSLIAQGQAQSNRANDDPVVQVISQPIRVLAPRPVPCNSGRQLAENILSIDDDDKLPPEVRKMQNKFLSQSDDGLQDFGPLPLLQPPSFLRQSTNLGVQFQVPRKASTPGKQELRRPRLIARVDSTKAAATRVRIYASPKNVDFQEPTPSRARTPYPAETLTELEYRGVIGTKPKGDCDADSRSITKPEHNRWKSAKTKFDSAKEDVMAKFGIKTKRVPREAEKLGYMPLTHHAKASIPSSGPRDDQFDNKFEQKRQEIERWRIRASGENKAVEGPHTDAEDLRVWEANGHRPNMTTAAGHAIACPSMKDRFLHLREKAFRSKPNLRERM